MSFNITPSDGKRRILSITSIIGQMPDVKKTSSPQAGSGTPAQSGDVFTLEHICKEMITKKMAGRKYTPKTRA